MRQQRSNLGEKGVGEDCRNFLITLASRVADKLGYIHFQRIGQPLQRTQRRDRFSVLDLGDVGSWNLHPPRKLALA